MLEKDPAQRPSAQELLDQLPGPGRAEMGTITQALNRSWILPASEVIHVDSAEGGRQGIDVDAREEVSTPAGAPGNSHLAGRASGWHVDPEGNGGLRRWDGIAWTDNFADAPSIEPGSQSPLGIDESGDQPERRPATRHIAGRLLLGGIAVLIVITGTVIGALQLNTGGTNARPGGHIRYNEFAGGRKHSRFAVCNSGSRPEPVANIDFNAGRRQPGG